MKKHKRLLCSGIACVLLLMGCLSAASAQGSTANEDIITLKWWAFPTFAQDQPQDVSGTYEQKIIRAFEAANPNVRVELTMLDFTTGSEKLTLTLGSDQACDVLFDAPGRIIDYGKKGALVPLNDLFDELFLADVDNSALVSACMDGDTPYMYPLSSAPFYMAFNKQMLEQAGVVDLVKDGWTKEDFIAVISALHEQGFVPGSVFCRDQGGDQGTRAFFANLFDAQIMDAACTMYTIADDKGIQAAAMIKDCVDRGLLKNGTYDNGTAAIVDFANGQTSFSLLWGPSQQNAYAGLLKDNGIEVVEVPYPSQDGQAALEYLVNGFCVVNNGDDRKIAAAKELIRFLCDDAEWGPQNVVHTGCIPVRSSFGSLYLDARMEQIMTWTNDYAPYYNTVEGFSQMRTAWSQMLKNLLNGYQQPEEALKLFAEQANQSLHR